MNTVIPDNKQVFTTVSQAVEKTANGSGGEIRLLRGGTFEQISRSEILTLGCAAARLFSENGIEPGERVLTVLPTCKAFLAATFGAWFAGGAIVPVAPFAAGGNLEKYQEKLAAMIRVAAPRVIVGTHNSLAALAGFETAFDDVKFLTDEDILNCPANGDFAPLYEPQPEDLAHIQFTSGSTGFPKGAAITHGQIADNVRNVGKIVVDGQPANDLFISWLPVHHDMGFIGGLCFPLYHNCNLHLIPTEKFIRNPAIWLETISSAGGTLSPAPTFAYELLATRIPDSRLEKIDLSSWRYGWVGAEPIFPNILQKFNERFARYGLKETTLKPCYGLAEATLAVTLNPLDSAYKTEWINRTALRECDSAERAEPDDLDSIAIVCCGAPIAETELQIIDKNGATPGERRQGRVFVRGASVMSGYFNKTEQPVDADGWLDTGDLGFLLDGELYVTGRAKDLIIRGGVNIHPQEIEAAAQTVAGVRLGRTAAFSIINHESNSEEVIITVETREKDADLRANLVEEITREIIKQAGVRVDRVELVSSGFIPKTTSGKIQRGICREKLLENDLSISL